MKDIRIYFLMVIFFAALPLNSCTDDRGPISDNVYTEANQSEALAVNSASGSGQDLGRLNNDINNSRQNAITNSVASACPAIVGINVTEVHEVRYRNAVFDDPWIRHFFGNRFSKPRIRKQTVKGLGSGFIISEDGYILTNHHVAGNASEVVITLTNGEKYNAEIIGSDKRADVALLKIDAEGLDYLPLGNSDEIITGEWAIAFGNPFGLFDINAKPTVTVGVVSNKGVSFMNDGRVYRDMIQTDAAISSGNSGGPLVNARGEVIGMNTVIFSTAQSQQGSGSIGIGFSIPINRVKMIVELLKNHGSIDRNYYVGMEVREIDEQLSKYITSDVENGVVVFSINRNSMAERTGFEPGDVILEIDGNPINRVDDYNVVINDYKVGDRLKFLVLRDDKKHELALELKPLRR